MDTMTNEMPTCRICGNAEGNIDYLFKEKQFGTGEPFAYFECVRCGCLQVAEIPEDMSRYYPADYESHRPVPSAKFNTCRKYFKTQFLNYKLGKFTPFGAAQALLSKTPPVVEWLAASNTGPDSSVLDVGCGMGNLLAKFWQAGIRQLDGIDPFIPSDIKYTDNLSIHKIPIEEWNGTHDLVTSNHSFEHVPNPIAFLKTMSDFLAPGGTLLIRIPLMGKYAWREFGENWAQLDAPRHLFLHTESSMEHLADLTGLEIYKTIYDSTSEQLANCIKYQKGIPYDASNKKVFSKSQLNEFKALAKILNAKSDGDQATFFLRKK